jgi:hypothetical protein
MEETEALPKNIIKDLVIKYQFDEKTAYLAKLLSLPKNSINNKLSQSLKRYKEELEEYRNSGNHHKTDYEDTERNMQQINTALESTEKSLGKNSKPYKVLLASLKAQENLIKHYETSIEDEKLDNLAIAQNSLEKMSIILEALYLSATNEQEIEENKKLYKKLSLEFHPDKTINEDNNIQQQKNDFFKTFKPLLSSNTNNNHLDDTIKAIHEKRNEIIQRINNPSILTHIAHLSCSTALPHIGQAIGAALCNKTFTKLMPSSAEENICNTACVNSARKTALQIETKLVKLPRHL